MKRPSAGALWTAVAAVFASGVPLWLWYAPDVTQYRMAMPSWGDIVRQVHATGAALLLAGALVHGIRRRGAGERTGVHAFLAVALAGVTGAWASPGTTGNLLWGIIGQREPTTTAMEQVVLLHVGVAALLAAALLYVHGSRAGWRARWDESLVVAVAITVIVWRAPRYEPSIFPNWWWEFPLWVVAPPVTIVWAWSLAAGMWLWVRWRFAPTHPRG